MDKSDWVWMAHPGHFICARDCRFFLNTYVGNFIVSTVGEYLPDYPVREIIADSRNIKLEGKGDARLADFMQKIGYEDIGLNRKYETMVFAAKKSDRICCPYEVSEFSELEIQGYNSADEAYLGHLELCLKYSSRQTPDTSFGDKTQIANA